MSKEVLFNDEGRVKIKRGLDIAANAVKSTIGSKGRNAFIDDIMQPKITNDGVTIAKSITLPDKFENMGAWLVKSTSAQTNEDAGDGTSTTAVLLQAIATEAMKRPENKMDVKRDLDRVGAKVVKMIEDSSRPVEDGQVESVATISAESPEIGKMIAELLAKGGKMMPITVDDNKFGHEIEYTITEGLETRNGFAHPLFINDEKQGVADYENVHVFACERRISSLIDIKQLLEQLDAHKIGTLVMIVSDIDTVALGQLVLGKAKGQFNSLVIKVRHQNDLEDMAAAAGATLISESSGVKLTEVTVEHLGLAKRVTSTDKKTVIVNNSPKTKDYIEFLRVAANNEQNYYDKKSLSTRADRLEGGIALIKVGAHSDSEREYLKHKVEDAVNATKSALEEGLVEGGGMCLYRIANKLKGNSVGETILRAALKAPLQAIIENAEDDYVGITGKITKMRGYNASTGKMVDMFKEGIVDPAKVTRCALQNAVSSAGTFITHGVAIAELAAKDHETK